LDMLTVGSDSKWVVLLRILFYILPNFDLTYGLVRIVSMELDGRSNPFAYGEAGAALLAMGIEGIVFFALVLIIEIKCKKFEWHRYGRRCPGAVHCWRRLPEPADDIPNEEALDEDVVRERERVLQLNGADDMLTVTQIKKRFRTQSLKCSSQTRDALRGVTFGCRSGECFGLLGPNGAGKTTLLEILCGEISADSGTASIAGNSIQELDLRKAYRILGYCPQAGALIDLMTGREHLEMFARIKGVPVDETVSEIVRALCLEDHIDHLARDCSGGTRRKLALGIAMIGSPGIIFLDEPSCGVDPAARRAMWNFLASNLSDRCVVLTTHSMEEADALSTTTAIMVDGQLVCIGSSQHLKSRFGSGYVLEIKTQDDEEDEADRFVKTELCAQARLLETHGNRMRYHIPDLQECGGLGTIFYTLEQVKQGHGHKFSLVSYSFSQSSLEQVFLQFAQRQASVLDPSADSNTMNVNVAL